MSRDFVRELTVSWKDIRLPR